MANHGWPLTWNLDHGILEPQEAHARREGGTPLASPLNLREAQGLYANHFHFQVLTLRPMMNVTFRI